MRSDVSVEWRLQRNSAPVFSFGSRPLPTPFTRGGGQMSTLMFVNVDKYFEEVIVIELIAQGLAGRSKERSFHTTLEWHPRLLRSTMSSGFAADRIARKCTGKVRSTATRCRSSLIASSSPCAAEPADAL